MDLSLLVGFGERSCCFLPIGMLVLEQVAWFLLVCAHALMVLR